MEFAQEEEKFIMDQLLDGQRLGYFDTNVNHQDSQELAEDVIMADQNAGFGDNQRLISSFI